MDAIVNLLKAQSMIDYMADHEKPTHDWRYIARALNIAEPVANIILDDLVKDGWVARLNDTNVRLLRTGDYMQWSVKKEKRDQQTDEINNIPKKPLEHWFDKNSWAKYLIGIIVGAIVGAILYKIIP